MLLEPLVSTIETIKARIATHGTSLTEPHTRAALIDPLLTALGWDTNDLGVVVPEYKVSGGGVADYALLKLDGNPLVLLEIKRLGEPLAKHRRQMAGYAAVSGTSYAGLTDGNHWELYDMFRHGSLEDKRALQVCIADTPPYQGAWSLWTLRRTDLESKQPIKANAPVLVEEQLRDMAPVAKSIEPQRILNEVADYYGLELEALLVRSRKQSVSRPRQMAMFLLTKELKLTPTHVGRLLGGRDHSTVIHGANQVNSKIKDDTELLSDALAILEKCGGASSQIQQG